MLFDEKMAKTIHLALGRSMGKSVGDDNNPNESAIHKDIVTDTSEAPMTSHETSAEVMTDHAAAHHCWHAITEQR